MAVILVVDDDLRLRDVLQRGLQRAGHTVLVATNGLEGARVWRERGADLALVDIHMPEMDGIELLAQLRAIAPELPVIMMSGGDQTRRLGLLDDARLLGAVHILAKPFSLDEVVGAVAAVLGKGGD